MSQLYHSDIHNSSRTVESYWEASAGPPVEGWSPLSGDAQCEVAIIGGGYTGLSAALHLARDHGVDVRVLEAGVPGWGASGRNGGFACRGSAKLSYQQILARFGRDAVRHFHATQVESTELVAAIAAEEGIEIDATPKGEIYVAHKPNRMAEIEAERDFQRDVLDQPSEVWSREELTERAYSGPEAFGALFTPVGFGIHPLKYCRGLARAAIRRGAIVHGLSKVIRWERGGARHRLVTAGGTLTARRVIVATAGFTQEGLHPAFDGVLLPVLSNIVTTRPLTEAERAAQDWKTERTVSDSRNLLFYYRMLKDGRFMLGARGGLSASPSSAPRMRAWMAKRLGEMYPAWKGVEITHFWRGLTDLSYDLLPHLGRLPDDPSVSYALAYHGNGVAMGSWAGRHLARDLVGRNDLGGSTAPIVMTQPLRRFPLPPLRMTYLRAAYAWFDAQDRYL
jgi:glycine/D-amino acid oxidase-like deaminating enzyme